MKIEMLSTSAGPETVLKVGQRVDMPDDEAKQLVDGGYAVAVDSVAAQPKALADNANNADAENEQAKGAGKSRGKATK